MGKFFKGKPKDDLKSVVDAASALNVSEFEVFCLAYQHWFGHSADTREMNAFFGRYMNTAVAPMWVRDFTRRVRTIQEDNRSHADAEALDTHTQPPATHWTAFLGGMAFAFMIMIIALLIYLVLQTEEATMMNCQLPPCY
jgi:hypothetical protein